MQNVKIIFFGSTEDSLIVLTTLCQTSCVMCQAVVTQPPRAVGRKQIITPTPVETWTKSHNIPVLSFSSDPDKPWLYTDENTVIDALAPFKPDLIVSACYGQRIPIQAIQAARYGGLNVHPSLLPRWRGADPVPWAICSGDHQTGVTVVTLSEQFDAGTIIAQKKVPILPTDMSDALRTKLFTLGADLLMNIMPDFLSHKKPISQSSHPPLSPSPYARRLNRDDGFEPWEAIQRAGTDPIEAGRMGRKFRAFHPWPGIWTKIQIKNHGLGVTEEKRLKILACHLDPVSGLFTNDSVQLEGKNPVSWKQFVSAHIPMQRSN